MRALLSLAVLGCSMTNASSEPRGDEGPLVVELFTSQGCSSCPPAEALVNKLARSHELGGRAVVPLAYHVDYWDYLGWADPYASAKWTARQQDYARAFDDRVYTPELVVAGSTPMVGSHAIKAGNAIAAAPKQLRIAATGAWTKSGLVIQATAPANADVYVAIWQDHTKVNVVRGENAGETLPGDHVVRSLVRVARAGTTEKVTIPLDSSWSASLGAVAFAQQGDRKIIGATLLPARK
jgi:hypothetical protein